MIPEVTIITQIEEINKALIKLRASSVILVWESVPVTLEWQIPGGELIIRMAVVIPGNPI